MLHCLWWSAGWTVRLCLEELGLRCWWWWSRERSEPTEDLEPELLEDVELLGGGWSREEEEEVLTDAAPPPPPPPPAPAAAAAPSSAAMAFLRYLP